MSPSSPPGAEPAALPAVPVLRWHAAVLLFATVVLSWGLTWTATKILVAEVTPLWTSALRSAVGTAVLLVLLAATRQLIVPRRGDVPVVLVVALFHMVGFSPLVAAGLTVAPVGRSIVLGYTMPLWVLPGAWLFLGEAITARKLAGVALALGGLGVLFNPAAIDWRNGSLLGGQALILAAAACWAVSIVYVRGHRWLATPFQLVFWQALVATVLLTAAAWAVDGPLVVEWTPRLLGALGFAGRVGTGLALWASAVVSRGRPAVTTSLGVLATPLVGIGSATLLLGERVTLDLVVAVALVLGGTALGTSGGRRRR